MRRYSGADRLRGRADASVAEHVLTDIVSWIAYYRASVDWCRHNGAEERAVHVGGTLSDLEGAIEASRRRHELAEKLACAQSAVKQKQCTNCEGCGFVVTVGGMEQPMLGYSGKGPDDYAGEEPRQCVYCHGQGYREVGP